ncbi:hypothetical protein [Methanoregula sp.]|uniref:hypothetical protein n=1 Tax=Methanoregula sp. TaxID=2052170 RepID=UPI00260EAC1C|nr:hypothetical protein [Methanoregula sp.]MDD5143411.1 hypothetical protein [Methanoregula sp.]
MPAEIILMWCMEGESPAPSQQSDPAPYPSIAASDAVVRTHVWTKTFQSSSGWIAKRNHHPGRDPAGIPHVPDTILHQKAGSRERGSGTVNT